MADFVRSLQTELQSSTYRSNNDFHQRGDTKSSNKNDHSRSQSNDSNRSGQSVRFQSSQGRERPNNAGRSDKTQKQQYRQDSPIPRNKATITTRKTIGSRASVAHAKIIQRRSAKLVSIV